MNNMKDTKSINNERGQGRAGGNGNVRGFRPMKIPRNLSRGVFISCKCQMQLAY